MNLTATQSTQPQQDTEATRPRKASTRSHIRSSRLLSKRTHTPGEVPLQVQPDPIGVALSALGEIFRALREDLAEIKAQLGPARLRAGTNNETSDPVLLCELAKEPGMPSARTLRRYVSAGLLPSATRPRGNGSSRVYVSRREVLQLLSRGNR